MELDGDVLLAADLAEESVRGDAVARRGPLGVQQE